MHAPKAKPIRAELVSDDQATACGAVARSPSPVLKLCRLLLAAGHDPAAPLEAWRKDTLCLRIRSIGEAAGLAVRSSGNGTPVFARGGQGAEAPPSDVSASGDPPATPAQEVAA
jgi:hypothetical protein